MTCSEQSRIKPCPVHPHKTQRGPATVCFSPGKRQPKQGPSEEVAGRQARSLQALCPALPRHTGSPALGLPDRARVHPQEGHMCLLVGDQHGLCLALNPDPHGLCCSLWALQPCSPELSCLHGLGLTVCGEPSHPISQESPGHRAHLHIPLECSVQGLHCLHVSGVSYMCPSRGFGLMLLCPCPGSGRFSTEACPSAEPQQHLGTGRHAAGVTASAEQAPHSPPSQLLCRASHPTIINTS